jgi:hypothetical protein
MVRNAVLTRHPRQRRRTTPRAAVRALRPCAGPAGLDPFRSGRSSCWCAPGDRSGQATRAPRQAALYRSRPPPCTPCGGAGLRTGRGSSAGAWSRRCRSSLCPSHRCSLISSCCNRRLERSNHRPAACASRAAARCSSRSRSEGAAQWPVRANSSPCTGRRLGRQAVASRTLRRARRATDSRWLERRRERNRSGRQYRRTGCPQRSAVEQAAACSSIER